MEKVENGHIVRISHDPDGPGEGGYCSKKYVAKTEAEATRIGQAGMKARPVGKDHRGSKKGRSKGRRGRTSQPTLSIPGLTKREAKLTARKKG